MVNVLVGPRSRMRTCWPTLKPYFCAVPRSITTSCEVVGGAPCTMCRTEICLSGSKEMPIPGAPPFEIAFPSGAMNSAPPVTEPSAASTPGTSRTLARSDSGTGLRVAVPPLPSWATPRTWKSMFW